ncbi:MAG TPA: hydrogenase maturation protease [Acidilobales archaeon]|nr:hydrogenase maturation protease [Acidilobales archaeon]
MSGFKCTRDVGNVAGSLIKVLKKSLIMCLGNELRMDDGAGLVFCRKLKERNIGITKIIFAYTFPLAYVDKIRDSKVKDLVIVDAIYGCKEPGEILFTKLDPLMIIEPELVSTHNIPLKLVIDYIRSECGDLNIYLLGFQVRNVDFGLELSPELTKAINNLINELRRVK